jgi:hypothetical protein
MMIYSVQKYPISNQNKLKYNHKMKTNKILRINKIQVNNNLNKMKKYLKHQVSHHKIFKNKNSKMVKILKTIKSNSNNAKFNKKNKFMKCLLITRK